MNIKIYDDDDKHHINNNINNFEEEENKALSINGKAKANDEN